MYIRLNSRQSLPNKRKSMRYSIETRQQGFTLIELLIAMVIALVLITALSKVFISQRKTYAVQEQITEMQQKARAAMEFISREVKMAGYDPSKKAGITVGIPYSATQLEIIADLNGDGDTSDSNEIIIYTGNSENSVKIERQDGVETPVTLAETWPYGTFGFTYWEGDGTTEVTSSANEGNIRQVYITITIPTSKSDPNYGLNSGRRTYTLSSHITPPNLNLF
jgi:type IV pilus assembly protein PilW